MEQVRAGDRFVTTQEVRATGLSMWKAPVTGSFEMVIPQGTVLVADEQLAGAPGFACVPDRYQELEGALVPEKDRIADKYNGYYFVFLVADIGRTVKPLTFR